MSISSDDDDTNWKVDLEILILEDNPTFNSIRQICQNRPFPNHLRRDIWRLYLKPNELSSITDNDFIPISNIDESLLLAAKETAERALSNAQTLNCQINSRNQDIFEKLSVNSDDDEEVAEVDFDCVKSSNSETAESLGQKFAQIILMYCSEYSKTFDLKNGWLEILCILYEVLECSRPSELYTFFLSIQHRFIANGFLEDNRTCNVLRLLLQYHEPLVCSLFECNRLSFEKFSLDWFTSLFASSTKRPTAYALWDLYFLQSNPLLKIFIALVLLVNAKSDLIYPEDEDDPISDDEEALIKDLEFKSRIKLKIYEKEELLNKVLALTEPMEVSDLSSLIAIALSYFNSTPNSFRQQYLELLFFNVDITKSQNLFSSALCLHVSPQELIGWHKTALKNYQTSNNDDLGSSEEECEIDYLPIDLRSPEEYNAGHLKAAFFLDAKLKVEDPISFKKKVQALFEMQRKTKAKIGHIILMGSVWDGSFEEEKFSENVSNLNMVIAYFLRLQICNVSVLEGGYAALHEALGTFGIKEHFSNHSIERCLVCKTDPKVQSTMSLSGTNSIMKNQLPNALQNTAQKAVNMANEGLFKKFSSLFNQQGVETQQFTNKIYPSFAKTATQQTGVTGQDQRAYRNTDSVFTIDDETSSEEETAGKLPLQNTQKPENEGVRNSPKLDAIRKSMKIAPLDYDQLLLQDSLNENAKDLKDFPHRENGLDECLLGDRIVVCNLEKRSELKGFFDCLYVNNENNRCGSGHFLVTEIFIIFLRDERSLIGTQFVPLSGAISNVSKQFKTWLSNKIVIQAKDDRIIENKFTTSPSVERECVVNKIGIDEIIRINTNKKIPEIISFIYGNGELVSMGQQPNRYRVYLYKSGDAINLIKKLIYLSDSSKG